MCLILVAMLSKTDLKRIAKVRLDDAKALYEANRLDGATYLCGYVIEIALKHRVCRTLKWDTFPESAGDFKGLTSFKTHDLDLLLKLSGIESKVRERFLLEWSIVRTWNPELRYSRVLSMNRIETVRRKSEVLSIINATELLMNVL